MSRIARDTSGMRPPANAGAGITTGPLTASVLIIGFGNVLLSDDGAGVRVAQYLRFELGDSNANFVDGGTLSFSLLSSIESTDAMLIVDAAQLNQAPGTVRIYEGIAMDTFLKSTRRRTIHEVGIIDLLDMARLEDCLPRRRALLCVQPARIDWSDRLSDAVERALPAASRQARQLLQRWKQAS